MKILGRTLHTHNGLEQIPLGCQVTRLTAAPLAPMDNYQRFLKAFDEVISFEGSEYTDLPQDKGGPTKWGISQNSHPDLDIKNLTKQQAQVIYWRDYWNKLYLDLIYDDTLATELFEEGVNLGIYKVQEITQRALNFIGEDLKVDGKFGPVTLQAINRNVQRDFNTFMKALNGLQFMHYYNIIEKDPTQKIFARGWLRRIKF